MLQVSATVAAVCRRPDAANARQPERGRRGFDANNLLTMQTPLMPKWADPIKRPARRARPRRRPRTARRAGRAAFGSMLPSGRRLAILQRRGPSAPSWRSAGCVIPYRYRRLSADARVTLVEGRLLDARDGCDAPRAVVINETLARQFMPGQSALGRTNPIRPDGAVVHRRRRREGRPRSWIRARVEALCLRDGGTGATLLSDGESDRARRQRPARLCAGSPADRP